MIRTDRLGELDARYRDRVWTFRDTESAAKEAKLVEELLASADLRSPTAPEVRSVGQASNGQVTWQAASPSAPRQPEEQAVTVSPSEYSAPASAVPTFIDTTTMGKAERPRCRLRVPSSVVATLAAVFFVATLGTGFVALRQNTSAGQWRQHDKSEVALNHALSTSNEVLSRDLVSAHAAITSLNSQTSKSNGQVKRLRIQLSSVPNTRGMLRQYALLKQLTSQAGTVSNELSLCDLDVNSLQSEIERDLTNLRHTDPRLQSNTHSTGQLCAEAQQYNQQLHSTLSAPG